ncbi:MAG TPA: hypothetical protein VGB97_00585 [Candidatus Paceibacterota bacterium]|jgi:hypothetical protein
MFFKPHEDRLSALIAELSHLQPQLESLLKSLDSLNPWDAVVMLHTIASHEPASLSNLIQEYQVLKGMVNQSIFRKLDGLDNRFSLVRRGFDLNPPKTFGADHEACDLVVNLPERARAQVREHIESLLHHMTSVRVLI